MYPLHVLLNLFPELETASNNINCHISSRKECRGLLSSRYYSIQLCCCFSAVIPLEQSSWTHLLHPPLSFRSCKGFMHMKFTRSADGRYILGENSPPFCTIPEVIHYYTTHKLPIRGAEHTSLLYPVIVQTLWHWCIRTFLLVLLKTMYTQHLVISSPVPTFFCRYSTCHTFLRLGSLVPRFLSTTIPVSTLAAQQVSSVPHEPVKWCCHWNPCILMTRTPENQWPLKTRLFTENLLVKNKTKKLTQKALVLKFLGIVAFMYCYTTISLHYCRSKTIQADSQWITVGFWGGGLARANNLDRFSYQLSKRPNED